MGPALQRAKEWIITKIMSRNRLELIEQKFGRLTVIEFSHVDKKGYTCWLCKCDCGNDKVINGSSLQSEATKSCGCLRKEVAKKAMKKIVENQRLPKGVAARNAAIYSHKISAKKRNIKQVLTDKQILILHKQDCHYCGSPPSNISSCVDLNGSYTYSGIDRIDNAKGYILANVVPCCNNCNSAKMTRTYDEFLSWIKQIHSHLNL